LHGEFPVPVAYRKYLAIDGRNADSKLVRIGLPEFRDVSRKLAFLNILVLVICDLNNFLKAETVWH